MTDPARDAAINVLGSVNVFAAAAAAGVRRVVNTSTGGAIYGDTETVPTPETYPAEPASAYGLGKLTVERYADWFGRAHGLDVVTLRYGNVYGPRQDPKGDAGVIAILCDRVLTGSRPTVFGDGLPDPGLRVRRGHRRGQPGGVGGRRPSAPGVQHRHRDRGRACSSWSTPWPRPRAWRPSGSRPSSLPPAPVRCAAAAWTSAELAPNSTSRRRPRWSRACARPWPGSWVRPA